jgi:hypothetical protein
MLPSIPEVLPVGGVSEFGGLTVPVPWHFGHSINSTIFLAFSF